MLFGILIITAATWGIISSKGNSEFTITVCDEYYGDYEGEDALYTILQYTGDIINIDLYEHGKKLIQNYEIPYPNEALIIFIYVKNYNNYTKNGFNDTNDAISIFYPKVN